MGLRSDPVLLTLSPLPLDEGTAVVLESGIPHISLFIYTPFTRAHPCCLPPACCPSPSDVASALRSEPVLLTLSPLPLDEGTAMVLESGIPRIKPAEAQKISANFNANPLMLNIIIDALKTGRITIDQALDGTGLATIAESDKQIDQVGPIRRGCGC